jgi:hypothetical protein
MFEMVIVVRGTLTSLLRNTRRRLRNALNSKRALKVTLGIHQTV